MSLPGFDIDWLEGKAARDPQRYGPALADARTQTTRAVQSGVAQTIAEAEGTAHREEHVQRSVIDAAQAEGFVILQTTVRYRKCPNCGEIDHRGYGAHEGVPDTLMLRVVTGYFHNHSKDSKP